MTKKTRKPGRPKKSNAGRPTKMTKITIKKLEEAFALGCPKTIACKYAGITTETLYKYIKENPKFSDRIAELQELIGLQARRAIFLAICEGDAKAAIDYLKRKYKDEFSEKIETDHTFKQSPVTDKLAEATQAILDKMKGEV